MNGHQGQGQDQAPSQDPDQGQIQSRRLPENFVAVKCRGEAQYRNYSFEVPRRYESSKMYLQDLRFGKIKERKL